MDNDNYQSCYLSEIGHNNFWYPTQVLSFMERNCDYTKLAWLGGMHRDLVALKVRKSCILAFKKKQRKEFIIVWVEKDKLPLSSVGRASDC